MLTCKTLLRNASKTWVILFGFPTTIAEYDIRSILVVAPWTPKAIHIKLHRNAIEILNCQ